MEGNFLSRYNNRIGEWNELIKKEPMNRGKYESEMAEYIMKCMPYLDQHVEDGEEKEFVPKYTIDKTIRKDVCDNLTLSENTLNNYLTKLRKKKALLGNSINTMFTGSSTVIKIVFQNHDYIER